MSAPATSAPDEKEAPALLGVFAHPDDEQFGTSGGLLTCADRGIAIHILTATRGDAGQISDPALATRDTLAQVREQELRDACRMLGFLEPEFLDYRDGTLAEADSNTLVRHIVAAIRRVRPRVILTFDANGGYGHITIHHATLAAYRAAADPSYDPESGTPHTADKLYVTAYPRSLLVRLDQELTQYGLPVLDFGDVQTLAANEFGTADERITTAVSVDHLWERRWPAFLVHRTQLGSGNPFVELPEAVVRSIMATDHFVRLIPPPTPDTTLPDETDLWSGLPLPKRS